MTSKRMRRDLTDDDAVTPRQFFVDNPFPMFVFDPQTLTIIDVNESAVEHYGFSREEFTGMPMGKVRLGSDAELVQRLQNLPKGRVQWFSSAHRKRDGTVINVKVAVGDILWKGEEACFSIVQDVTDDLRIQAELARVLSFVQIGIWEYNIATKAVSWTDEVYSILGYASKTPVSFEQFRAHISPDDRGRFDAALKAALATGEPFEIEHRIVRRDGKERIVNASAVIELDADRKPVRAMGTVMDVTSRREVELDLRLRGEALAMAQRIAGLGSWDQDLITGRGEWTRELFEVYGMKPDVDEPAPDELWKHDHPDDAAEVLRTISQAREKHTRYDLDHRIVRRDGEIRWVHEQGEYVYDGAGKPTRFIGTVLDITDRKQTKARIEFLATHDQVTGLPNYPSLLDRLCESLARAQHTKGAVAVAFLDVDRFKTVNDALGHSAGDAVLKEIARRLELAVQSGDTVARVGGDEFIVVLSDVQDTAEIAARTRRILDSFQSPIRVGEREFFFTASMGLSIYPKDGSDAAQLIHNADMAMYQAKKTATNSVQHFSDRIQEATLRRLSIEEELRGAIDRDELYLEYQPILQAKSRAIVGVEALVRWRPKNSIQIGPAEFIPIAEDSGLIVSIGNWIIRQACRQWHAWCDDSRAIRLSVNISGKQIERPDFINVVQSALFDAQMHPGYLDLEVTETVLMTQSTLPSLEALRGLGVRLVIDDFGTGYSSLSYLKQMPVSALKIDRSFVAYAQTSQADIPISSAIVSIAHNLGLEVVAEGVETEAQASILRDLSCDFLQGYYFARPAAAEVTGALLKRRR